MNLNEFKSLVLSRQSCRSFSDKEIDVNDLKEILDVALLAPSACNSQPWKVYCVTDREKVKKVAQSVSDGGVNSFASSAKAFFVVAEKTASLKKGAEEKFGRNHFVKYDIGELIAYITLAAKAKGIDTCIIGWINAEKLNAAMNFDDGESCNIVIAAGYGDCPLREKVRKPSGETSQFI